MVGTATGAVPPYLAVLKWFLPDHFHLTSREKPFAVVPVVAFMAAAVIFLYGYMPIKGKFSIDMLDQIEEQRIESISRRAGAIKWGFAMFMIGVIGGAIVKIYLDPTVLPPTPTP